MVVLNQAGAQRLVDRITNRLRAEGISATAAGTAAKIVAVNSLRVRQMGTRIRISFTTNNTAAAPTLNANATGAGELWFRGARLTNTAPNRLQDHSPAGYVGEWMWDGARWQLLNSAIGGGAWFGTVTTAAGTAAKAAAISGFPTGTPATGQFVELRFTTGNTSATATLNISTTGAGNLLLLNTADRPLIAALPAMYTGFFVRDGTVWRLVTPANIRVGALNAAAVVTSVADIPNRNLGPGAIVFVRV